MTYDLYSAVSDIYFMISLYVYSILCMTRCLALEHQCPFQYSYVCSSMMSVHPEGGGSTWDTRVSLTSVDMVSRFAKCCWMSTIPMVCRDSRRVVTALFEP